MDTVPTTNPAGRLHALLEKAKSQRAGNAVDVWAAVFEIKAPDNHRKHVEVVHGLLQTEALIEETYQSLRAIPDLPERYFRPFERIRSVVTRSFAQLQVN